MRPDANADHHSDTDERAQMSALRRQRKTDAGEVQRRGSKRKARHIFNAADILGGFATMVVAVQQREHADDRRAKPDRQVDRQRHQQSERHHRR